MNFFVEQSDSCILMPMLYYFKEWKHILRKSTMCHEAVVFAFVVNSHNDFSTF